MSLACAKYTVVSEIVGVAKVSAPETNAVPPVALAYQSIFAPALALAIRFVVPLIQIFPFIDDVTVGKGFTVAVTTVFISCSRPATKLDVVPVKAKLYKVPFLPLDVLSISVVNPVLVPFAVPLLKL